MAALRFFGIQRLAVDREFKDPLGTRDEGEALDEVLVIAQDVVCRTGSTLLIVSRDTVFEGDHVFGHGIVSPG
jgi:hypothetical protein